MWANSNKRKMFEAFFLMSFYSLSFPDKGIKVDDSLSTWGTCTNFVSFLTYDAIGVFPVLYNL